LLKSSERFGIDIAELLTGETPKLSFYTIVRRGKGLPIERRKGFEYRHLAHLMKNRMTEPFLVTAPYVEAEQNKPIEYSQHEGQEFDIVLEGILKVDLEGYTEVLNEGDSIDGFLSGKSISLAASTIDGLDDFELVCFLTVK
jgi:hypothetical protein